MLYRLKSDGERARLSLTTKLPYHGRKYATSTDTRGSNSCCTPVENSQLYVRLPHPVIRSGSYVLPGTARPKFVLLKGSHSPFLAGSSRSQFGTKSWLSSCHVRVT